MGNAKQHEKNIQARQEPTLRHLRQPVNARRLMPNASLRREPRGHQHRAAVRATSKAILDKPTHWGATPASWQVQHHGTSFRGAGAAFKNPRFNALERRFSLTVTVVGLHFKALQWPAFQRFGAAFQRLGAAFQRCHAEPVSAPSALRGPSEPVVWQQVKPGLVDAKVADALVRHFPFS